MSTAIIIVKSNTGVLLAGAAVNAVLGDTKLTASADANGVAALTTLASTGVAALTASLDGYTGGSGEVTITDGAIATTIIELASTSATVVDGVDISKLTTEGLAGMAKEQWAEFYTVVKAAVKSKTDEEKAELKAKLAGIVDKWKTYVLPVVKYTAGAALLLKVFGMI